VTDEDGDDDDVISLYQVWNPQRFQRVTFVRPSINCTKYSKAIPLDAWTDPEGSMRLRLPDFKTIGT
jgi:hypothetical protein